MIVIKIFEIAAAVIFITSIVTIIVWMIGRYKKKEYDKNYAFLFSCVSYYVVNEYNFKKIHAMFRQLRMNDQFPEQTNLLWHVFRQRYNEYFQDTPEFIDSNNLTKSSN